MMPETEILKTIASDVRTIVWASDEDLSPLTPFYPTVDYLLDGLVRSHLEEEKKWSQVTFVHQVFGKSFWVVFANTKECDLNSFLSSVKNIIPEEGRSKMVVLNTEKLPSTWATPLDKIFAFVERI
jgi:hypothetical protein